MKWNPSVPVILFNASLIHTMEPELAAPYGTLKGETNSMCFQHGKIVAIGEHDTVETLCPEVQHRINANKAIVMPGLIDSHMHLMEGGLTLIRPVLNLCNSEEEVVEVLREFVKSNPVPQGQWLQGFGWDQNRWKRKIFPTKDSLDSVFPNTPVWLQRIDGHAGWANSAALKLVGQIPTENPVGGQVIRDLQGNPTGVFTDTARRFVQDIIPGPSKKEQRTAILAATSATAKQGITAIHNPGIGVDEANLYKDMIDEDSMTLRQYGMWLGTASGDAGTKVDLGTPMVRNYKGFLDVRAVKLYMDGALGSWGASMIVPYSDKPNESGQLRMTEAEFHGNVTAWVANGYQVATHAIGDRANRIVLENYSKICQQAVQQRSSRSLRASPAFQITPAGGTPIYNVAAGDLRLRIEHFQLVNQTDFATLGMHPRCILASMQPTHATSDMDFVVKRIGRERAKGAYAWNTALRVQTQFPVSRPPRDVRGRTGSPRVAPRVLAETVGRLALGSDWPTVGRIPPVLGFYAAITRQSLSGEPREGWEPQERITRWEALKGYTTDAAFAGFQENEMGSLTRGKWADFVLVDKDWLDESVPPREVLTTRFLATFVGGRRVVNGTFAVSLP